MALAAVVQEPDRVVVFYNNVSFLLAPFEGEINYCLRFKNTWHLFTERGEFLYIDCKHKGPIKIIFTVDEKTTFVVTEEMVYEFIGAGVVRYPEFKNVEKIELGKDERHLVLKTKETEHVLSI